jgi:hypothetical protein
LNIGEYYSPSEVCFDDDDDGICNNDTFRLPDKMVQLFCDNIDNNDTINIVNAQIYDFGMLVNVSFS